MLRRTLVLGAYSKALGDLVRPPVWNGTNAMLLQVRFHQNFQRLYTLLRSWSMLFIFLSFHYLKPIFLLFISLCCDAERRGTSQIFDHYHVRQGLER